MASCKSLGEPSGELIEELCEKTFRIQGPSKVSGQVVQKENSSELHNQQLSDSDGKIPLSFVSVQSERKLINYGSADELRRSVEDANTRVHHLRTNMGQPNPCSLKIDIASHRQQTLHLLAFPPHQLLQIFLLIEVPRIP